MPCDSIWKYCTGGMEKEYLLSLRLCRGMDLSPSQELAFLYGLSNHLERHYKEAAIPKKSGGIRRLWMPSPDLKLVQRNILHHVLSSRPVSPCAYAYQKGRRLADHGALHQGRERLLKLDIQNFFGSISFNDVYKKGFPGELFPPQVRTILSVLCCFRGILPQGAPTSPCLSNLIMGDFDCALGDFCGERSITYSRYCDDMVFSGQFEPGEVVNQVRHLLYPMNMKLNEKKTGVFGKGARHLVTGAVVNEKVQAPKEYRRKLRQECYYWLRFGEEKGGASLDRLLGKVNYVLDLNPEDTYFLKIRRELQKKV